MQRHFFKGDHGIGLVCLETVRHALDNVALSVQANDRIAKGDHERLVSGKKLGAEHGVPQSQELALPGEVVLQGCTLEFELCQEVFLPTLAQHLHQLAVQVEVIFDRSLAGSGDEKHAAHADARQLFDDVLHHGFAPDGQHLLGLGFRGGQQARAKTGYRDDRQVDVVYRIRLHTVIITNLYVG